METYHYRCPNCVTEFVSPNLLYCPFCATPLHQLGGAQYPPRDYVTAGWNAIAFRSKPGFVVKDVNDRSKR
jgi:hypothetical protein